MPEDVRAAAKRLLNEIDIHESLATDSLVRFEDDLETVARYALARAASDGETERMRKVLELAATDLIGFEGYFERQRSMGTVKSIRRTLDLIDRVLAAAPSSEGGDTSGEIRGRSYCPPSCRAQHR